MGPCRLARHPSALPGLDGGPGSPRDHPKRPRGKPVGTVVGPREAGRPVGADGMARPPGRVAGERREVAGTNRGTALAVRGRAGRTANAPTGAAGPSTRAGLMSAGLTPAREPRRWVHVPLPRLHSRDGGGGRMWHYAGDPGAAATDAPCEWERSAAGPVRAPGWASGAERRRRAEKGAGKEGAPAVLQCSAAPSPPARPRSAARHCGNADGSPARAGPNRSGHPLPGRAAPCPRRAGLPLSPASSGPFRFPPAPAGTAGRFLPRRDAAGWCPRDRPLALCLTGAGGLILPPALDAGGRRQQPPWWPPPAPRLLAAAPLDAGICEAPVLHRLEADPWSLPCSVPASPGRISLLPT